MSHSSIPFLEAIFNNLNKYIKSNQCHLSLSINELIIRHHSQIIHNILNSSHEHEEQDGPSGIRSMRMTMS